MLYVEIVVILFLSAAAGFGSGYVFSVIAEWAARRNVSNPNVEAGRARYRDF
jgi:hypothetical protein